MNSLLTFTVKRGKKKKFLEQASQLFFCLFSSGTEEKKKTEERKKEVRVPTKKGNKMNFFKRKKMKLIFV